jgi:dipeptidase E
VTVTWDAYAARVAEALGPLGVRVRPVHASDDPAGVVRDAAAVAVGGGNTFHLLAHLYRSGLLGAVRDRVAAGAPYLGWSAGSVVACPTLQTTNDMPVVEPPAFAALGLVGVQINAHYTDFHPPGFQGETRAERLAEFVAANPDAAVVGLPEGAGSRRAAPRSRSAGRTRRRCSATRARWSAWRPGSALAELEARA